MTRYSTKALTYLETVQSADKNRLRPILDLFEKCGEDTAVDYYHPNILYLSVKGKLALGLSPRKKYISFYVSSFETEKIFRNCALALGVSSQGAGCFRFNKLSDINMDALKLVFSDMYASDHTDGGVLIPLE